MHGDIRVNKSRAHKPPISFYLLNDDEPVMEAFSCNFCKRTILDIKGRIDTAISTPMPISDFGIAINIRCKLCGQNYRLLINPAQLANMQQR